MNNWLYPLGLYPGNTPEYLNMRMKKHLQKIGFVLISLLVTFLIAMGPIAKVDGFNVFPWLDIPFHIWGGFLLGLLALRLILIFEIYTDNKIAKRKSMDKMYRFCIYMTAFVFFFGLVWEAWEFYMYMSHRWSDWGGITDTVKDLFNDIVGGVLALIYNMKIINRNDE